MIYNNRQSCLFYSYFRKQKEGKLMKKTHLFTKFTRLYINKIISLEMLKNTYPDLFEQLKYSIYEYLISNEVSNANYQARPAYYGKAGKAETESIIRIDKESKKSNQSFTKIGSKYGDLVHNYFIYLFTKVKKKGKSIASSFIHSPN